MIPLPFKPKIIKKDKNTMIVEIEGLYPGYGTTIGNALRRVILSSLEGAAVTQMKIKGVSHEFSTIPGVIEDVLTIMLNLKELRFKMFTDEPQKATLKIKGEQEVKGEDFELPTQVEIVNKKAHIATLTEKSSQLELEIQIEKGIGYVAREKLSKEKAPAGTIFLDAIFTPIRKVSMTTENMRVGERTDFDKLILGIETDGTVSPEEAFITASKILIEQHQFLRESIETKNYEEGK